MAIAHFRMKSDGDRVEEDEMAYANYRVSCVEGLLELQVRIREAVRDRQELGVG